MGKSTLDAWIVLWIMSTRPHAKGTITANTFTQLRDKTEATLQHWTPLCLTGHWFTVGSDRLSHTTAPSSRFCAAQSCKEQNSEAFAASMRRIPLASIIFAEASAIPDVIYEVAEGG